MIALFNHLNHFKLKKHCLSFMYNETIKMYNKIINNTTTEYLIKDMVKKMLNMK